MDYEGHYHGWSPLRPYAPTFTGTFERRVRVGGKERRFLIYLPEGVRSGTAGIFVLGEDGKTADEILADSLWKTLADTEPSLEKMAVVILEPENGRWNREEPYGCPDGDVAYVKAVWNYWQVMDLACIHAAKYCLFGSREGGTVAHMAAMWDPCNYAGLATVDALPVSGAYMDAAREDRCADLHYIAVPELDIQKGGVPVPVWIIGEDLDTPQERYWREACGATAGKRQLAPDTWEHYREKPLPFPEECDLEACTVRVSRMESASRDHCRQVLPRVWKDHLFRHRRWAGNVCGDLQMTREPVRDLGMEYHFEHIAGYDREWYVYVPWQVRDAPGRPVPLVFALHGMQCSGAIYAEDSGWWQVADRYGFIAVFPSAVNLKMDMPMMGIGAEYQVKVPGWNFLQKEGPDELAFFRELLERVAADHPVHRGRVYVTGHSHGSVMSQTLGMAMPELFAAIAPCSGVLMDVCDSRKILELPEVVGRPDWVLPCWMFSGDAEAMLFDMLPGDQNTTGITIMQWRRICHLEPICPESWTDGWHSHGRWHDLTFTDAGGVPMVRYTWIGQLPHAVIRAQSFRIWEEFFSHFVRTGDSVKYINDQQEE